MITQIDQSQLEEQRDLLRSLWHQESRILVLVLWVDDSVVELTIASRDHLQGSLCDVLPVRAGDEQSGLGKKIDVRSDQEAIKLLEEDLQLAGFHSGDLCTGKKAISSLRNEEVKSYHDRKKTCR